MVFHLRFNGTVWLPIRKDKRVTLKRFKATRFGTCFSKGYSKLKVKLAQVTSLPRFTQATSHLPLWNFVTAITLLPNINMRTFKPRSYSLTTILVIFDCRGDTSENNGSFNSTYRKLKKNLPLTKIISPVRSGVQMFRTIRLLRTLGQAVLDCPFTILKAPKVT